jgi:hypothetical protein
MRRLYFALAAMTSWLMVLSLAPRAQSDLVRPRTGEAGVISCNGHLQVAQNYDYGAQNAPRDDDNDNVETAPPPSDQPGDNEATPPDSGGPEQASPPDNDTGTDSSQAEPGDNNDSNSDQSDSGSQGDAAPSDTP